MTYIYYIIIEIRKRKSPASKNYRSIENNNPFKDIKDNL